MWVEVKTGEAIFLRHLIPLRNEDTIRKRKSVPQQLYPIHQDERHESDHCLPETTLSLHQALTFSPPLSFPTSGFMHPNPQQAFIYLHSLCLISFTLTPVIQIILSASTPTPINIHPPRIYFNNVILISMPTRTCSSYAHLSCEFTSISTVSV